MLIRTNVAGIQVDEDELVQLEHQGKVVTVPASLLFSLVWDNSNVNYGPTYREIV